MTTIIDLWTKLPIETVKKYNKIIYGITPKTICGNYIVLTEYYGTKGYFTENERKDLASRKFREELKNPDLQYEDRIKYIKDYFEAKKEKDKICSHTQIKKGKIVYNDHLDDLIKELNDLDIELDSITEN